MLVQGAPTRIVSEMPGHASVMTTWDIYQHISESIQREAAGLLDPPLFAVDYEDAIVV